VPKTIPSKEMLQQFFYALKNLRDKVLFLLFASSGLRKTEVLSLRLDDLDRTKRMLVPKSHEGNESTKRCWVSFYNDEAENVLEQFLNAKNCCHSKLFELSINTNLKSWKKASEKTGFHITPQMLRVWFCSEMLKLGVQEIYIDAFCGRVPRSILARHYTDYSPERLKEIYDKANLKILP